MTMHMLTLVITCFHFIPTSTLAKLKKNSFIFLFVTAALCYHLNLKNIKANTLSTVEVTNLTVNRIINKRMANLPFASVALKTTEDVNFDKHRVFKRHLSDKNSTKLLLDYLFLKTNSEGAIPWLS